MNKEEILKALNELRKLGKKKFEQSVDLIINLKNFDIKRESINLFVSLPFKIKDVKIAAFLDNKSQIVNTITKNEFDRYRGKKEAKKLAKNYDFFIAHAKLLPSIASVFGKYLGSMGKMPSPQLGMIMTDSESEIRKMIEKVGKTIRVRAKEPSIKVIAGKENMKDEEIAENIITIYNEVLNALPGKIENIRSVLIKFTMSKPIKVKI